MRVNRHRPHPDFPRPHSNAPGTQISTVLSAMTAAHRLRWSDVVMPAVDPWLRATELEVMTATFATRAPDDWGALEIILVSRLAAQLAALMKDEAELRRTGSLVAAGEDGKKRNPLIDVVATRSTQVGSLMRQLGLSTPVVDRPQLAAARRVLDQARNVHDPDGLLA